MPLSKATFKYKGMVKDIAKESFSPEFYFDAQNIKIVSVDSQDTFAVSNERGTTLEFKIPTIVTKTLSGGKTKIEFVTEPASVETNSPLLYTWNHDEVMALNITNANHQIIGATAIKEFIILVTTNNAGVDCIWKVYKDYSSLANIHWVIDLVYINNLGLSSNNPLELKIRYDSVEFIKLYFTDFNSQLKHILLTDNTVHNLRASFLDIVPEYSMSQPIVTDKNWGGITYFWYDTIFL